MRSWKGCRVFDVHFSDTISGGQAREVHGAWWTSAMPKKDRASHSQNCMRTVLAILPLNQCWLPFSSDLYLCVIRTDIKLYLMGRTTLFGMRNNLHIVRVCGLWATHCDYPLQSTISSTNCISLLCRNNDCSIPCPIVGLAEDRQKDYCDL